MNAEERAHTEHLLEINMAHMRELEMQQAKLGILAPSGIAIQLAEYRHQIANLEDQLSKALPRHNLPPRDYEQFIGRQKELTEVRRLLQPYPKSRAYVITIDGIGGIGKSALALEAAYTLVEQYVNLPESERFEAVVWVSAKRSYLTADGILERRQAFRTLDDLYAAIAQVLDYPVITRTKVEEQRAIVEDVLREQRTLLILDNLETVDDDKLLSFLRELPDPTKAIVTTRHRIDVAHPIRLTSMPHEDTISLIQQEAVRKGVLLTQEEQEQLWQRSGGMPLAIVWSIGLMGLGGSIESVLRRLGSGQSDIARFCFEESVAQIRGRDAYWLLLALSLFATDASREALGVVAALGEDEFGCDTGLENLLRLSLVNKEGERFSLLPLTSSFVSSVGNSYKDWMQQTNRRIFDYLYSFTKMHGAWSKDWDGHNLVQIERDNIIRVIENRLAEIEFVQDDEGSRKVALHSVQDTRTVIDFIVISTQTFRLHGDWHEAERLCHLAIPISRELHLSTREPSDLAGYGWSCYQLSKHYFVISDGELLWKWGDIVQEIGQRAGVDRLHILGLRQLATAEMLRGNLQQAHELINQAMNLSIQTSNINMQQHLYGALGNILERRGDFTTAATWLEKACEGFEELKDFANAAAQRLYLGRVNIAANQLGEGRANYEKGLTFARESGRFDAIATALFYIAQLDTRLNPTASTIVSIRQCLTHFRRLGMKLQQAEAEALLARISQSADTPEHPK